VGNWNVAGNWTPAQVPNNGTPPGTTYNVLIDNGNVLNSSVSLNIVATIDNLTIDAGDSLGINHGQVLTLNSDGGVTAGTITNNGSFALNSAGALTELRLTGTGNVTLRGSGTLTLSNNVNNLIRDTDATQQRLVHAAGRTIQGAGQLGVNSMALTNRGTIIANQTNALPLTPML